MNKTSPHKLTAVCALVSIVSIAGCASGPYAPKEPQSMPQPVVKSPPEPTAKKEVREEEQDTKAKHVPKPVQVNLSIGPRDPEQAIDLSVDGPLVIPKEVFEQ